MLRARPPMRRVVYKLQVFVLARAAFDARPNINHKQFIFNRQDIWAILRLMLYSIFDQIILYLPQFLAKCKELK